MARKWTDEQKQAIQHPANILVNAAAGSGKTAVLVERIIQKLIPDKSGHFTDITRLLVVTFARDAAGEMQERIKRALTEYMFSAETEALAKHYKTQLKLVSQSDITTIDAFCIKAVRNNFHLLGIDPAFGIMDKTEADLLRAELADELCERMYESENESFMLLNKIYSGISDDYGLIKILIEIYEFTRSLPNPDEWLKSCAAKYYEHFSGSIWEQGAIAEKNRVTDMARKLFLNANRVMKNYSALNNFEFDELDPVFRSVRFGISICKKLENSDFDTTVELLKTVSSVPSKSMKKDDFSKFENEIISMISPAYSALKSLSEFFPFCCAEQDKMMREQIDIITALTELCIEFSKTVFKAKQEKNLYEFNDLEHLCLSLFTQYPEICEEYKNKYDEVLMDEYQDTNALQEAIFTAVSKENNRFMVGDMKQSIYRFRSSDPTIFKSKDQAFRKNPQLGTLISLTKNFRSRSEVLNSVNCIFKSIMHENTGEVEYDASQQLNCANLALEEKKHHPDAYTSELHIIETSDTAEDDENSNATIAEARYISEKIRELVNGDFKILDGENFRPVKYSDIAILSSSVRSISSDYLKILSDNEIPASAEGGKLFERSEIRMLCCIMSIICNPLQDIPLLSVLRSPVFSFTEDELVKIRICENGNFYKAMKKYAELTADSKCTAFLSRLQEWRELSKYTNSYKLLWIILSQTGLYDMAGIIYDEDACANIRLLTEMAKSYEKTGYKGLYNFSCYIDRLRKNNVDIDSVSTRKNSDCVRIITIHKSKGLEFPIVFLAGASKSFAGDKSSSAISMHKDYGIALQYTNYKTRKLADTVWQLVMDKIKTAESTAENMRKLYVALTRPKEKLIVTCTAKAIKYDKDGNYKSGGSAALTNAWNENISNDEYKILGARCYADWIGPCVMEQTKTKCPLWQLVIAEAPKSANMHTGAPKEKEYTDYITPEDINSVLGRKYPFSDKADIPSRMYVTQLKNLEQPVKTFEMKKRPEFTSPKALSGAQIGSAYHMILSVINTDAVLNLQTIQAEIDRICACGYITELEKSYVNAEKIFNFFEGDFGKQLKNTELHRETPFEMMVTSSDVFPGTDGEILIQGIIDCWFYNENGDIVLVDYKTDYINDPSELIEKYKTQIIWYKKALEQILNKTVAKCYIYSISKDTPILIDD